MIVSAAAAIFGSWGKPEDGSHKVSYWSRKKSACVPDDRRDEIPDLDCSSLSGLSQLLLFLVSVASRKETFFIWDMKYKKKKDLNTKDNEFILTYIFNVSLFQKWSNLDYKDS